MTPEERERQIGQLRKQIWYLETLTPVLEHVGHISARAIFCEYGDVERRRAAMVREFGPDTLVNYYMNDGNTLAIKYQHCQGEIEVVYFDSDNVDARLAQLSGGKCHIVTETETTHRVVCNTENPDNA